MGTLDARRENRPPLRLGELAVQAGLLSEAQLQHALAQQNQEAKSGRLPRQLGLILLTLGFIAEEDLIKLLSEQEWRRAVQGKMEAPSPQTGSKEGARHQGSLHALKKLPTLLVKPKEGSAGPPTS